MKTGRVHSRKTLCRFLIGIGNQIATAMENLQLLENQQQDAFIAAALLQVAQTVASQDDMQTILDSILNLLINSGRHRISSIFPS